MKNPFRFPLDRINVQRWLALPLSVALGGLLVTALFAGVRPRPAAAAALAEPATLYPCTEPGLNAALAAGGSATFNCGAPITVTARKTVTRAVQPGVVDGDAQQLHRQQRCSRLR